MYLSVNDVSSTVLCFIPQYRHLSVNDVSSTVLCVIPQYRHVSVNEERDVAPW